MFLYGQPVFEQELRISIKDGNGIANPPPARDKSARNGDACPHPFDYALPYWPAAYRAKRATSRRIPLLVTIPNRLIYQTEWSRAIMGSLSASSSGFVSA